MRLFVDGGSEPRCYSLGKLVLARGILVGNRNIKDEISTLQQKSAHSPFGKWAFLI